MPAKNRPVPVSETYWIVYRVETGAIVATATIWTEEGVPVDEPCLPYRRVESIMSDLAADAGPLDFIEVCELPAGAMRVDLASRTVVAGEQQAPEGLVVPAVLPRP
jgi:hypothetical protein